MKQHVETVRLEKIVGGGQSLGTLADGRKVFVWGALPGETAEVRIIKRKSHMAEGVAGRIITASRDRVEPEDPESYLSTSPWQIMSTRAETAWKETLVKEAFELHDIKLHESECISDGEMYGYRNKVEFSWWDVDDERLDLAFFKRGSKGKIPVDGTSLARPEINDAAHRVRDLLRKKDVSARALKTLLLRCSQKGEVNAQLYVKDDSFNALSENDVIKLRLHGFDIVYSNPQSPASVVTKILASYGQSNLTDTLLHVPFTYPTGGFFQVNLPVYEMALAHMRAWMHDRPVIDMYSGVGTIGLTIGGDYVTLIEQDEICVAEMRRNIEALGIKASVVPMASERALEHITRDHLVILDPPRAGLHNDVVDKLHDVRPSRLIYLSCNPVTQARDVAKLLGIYRISHAATFNFFPRTPHIEHLVVLD